MLNTKQKEIYDLVLNSNYRTFYLKGEAGTGKSFTLSKIVNDFNGSVLLTATTNKAKNLIQTLSKNKAYTTHSALGFVMTRNGINEYLSDIAPAKEADLLVVDEASMLPFAVYEKILKTPYKKILFVGDENQLDAIGAKANIISDIEITLNEQMRQDKNDTVLEAYMHNLRQAIKNKKMPDITASTDTIKVFTKFKDFAKEYLECDKQKRILAYSNKIVDKYNLSINNNSKFNIGDILVLDKPLANFKNSDVVEVLDVDDRLNDRYILSIAKDNIRLDNLWVFKNKRLQNSFFEQVLEEDKENYWTYMDKTINPKHLHASTIHKAQGDTIETVFIDVTDIFCQTKRKPSKFNNYNKAISVSEFSKLLYVAISRMKYKAYLFIGDKRDYSYLRNKNEKNR